MDGWDLLECKNRLNRLYFKVKDRFDHEIRETIISLSGDEPNIKMAIDRLNQMQKWLERNKP